MLRPGEAQRVLLAGDSRRVAQGLDEFLCRYPGDLHALALLARARAELGEWQQAFEAVDTLADRADHPDPAQLLRVEILIAADRLGEARATLAKVSPENIIGVGIQAVLDFFAPVEASGDPGGPEKLPLDPAALWFGPVLAVLIFFLERRLSRAEPTAEVHRARTWLFQPNLVAESFRDPSPSIFERLANAFRDEARRTQQRRELEIAGHFHAGDLKAAETGLRAWLGTDPQAYGDSADEDPRRGLLIEILFHDGRFEDVLAEMGKARNWAAVTAPSAGLLTAYAHLAVGKPGTTVELLGHKDPAAEATRAAVAHLRALAELHANHPERALAWYRRAVTLDDVGLVELARKELSALGCELTASP